MAKTNPPADADQAPADQTTAAPPERRFWRYTGPERLYAHIPVTVRDGDVVEHDGPPAGDGCWQPDDGPATVRPDNQLVDEVTPDA